MERKDLLKVRGYSSIETLVIVKTRFTDDVVCSDVGFASTDELCVDDLLAIVDDSLAIIDFLCEMAEEYEIGEERREKFQRGCERP